MPVDGSDTDSESVYFLSWLEDFIYCCFNWICSKAAKIQEITNFFLSLNVSETVSTILFSDLSEFMFTSILVIIFSSIIFKLRSDSELY